MRIHTRHTSNRDKNPEHRRAKYYALLEHSLLAKPETHMYTIINPSADRSLVSILLLEYCLNMSDRTDLFVYMCGAAS